MKMPLGQRPRTPLGRGAVSQLDLSSLNNTFEALGLAGQGFGGGRYLTASAYASRESHVGRGMLETSGYLPRDTPGGYLYGNPPIQPAGRGLGVGPAAPNLVGRVDSHPFTSAAASVASPGATRRSYPLMNAVTSESMARQMT
jgi:hypothetical protein